MQAEVLWVADSVGELTLDQTIPLNNLPGGLQGAWEAGFVTGIAERGTSSSVCSIYH